MTVQVLIKFKHSQKIDPKSTMAIAMEIECKSESEFIRDITAAVRKHSLDGDLQIPLFGEGNVRITELDEAFV